MRAALLAAVLLSACGARQPASEPTESPAPAEPPETAEATSAESSPESSVTRDAGADAPVDAPLDAPVEPEPHPGSRFTTVYRVEGAGCPGASAAIIGGECDRDLTPADGGLVVVASERDARRAHLTLETPIDFDRWVLVTTAGEGLPVRATGRLGVEIEGGRVTAYLAGNRCSGGAPTPDPIALERDAWLVPRPEAELRLVRRYALCPPLP